MKAQHDLAKAIFLDAVEIASAEERQAFVDAQCVGDDALRVEVQEFLAHHEGLGSFLQEAPGTPSSAIGAIGRGVSEGPGTLVGPYKLLEQIGEGGFGLVFMAEQFQPVRRKVAVKILKPGMDSRQVIARFEAERQALALMDHGNIARVLDAGETANGRPYFAMELVRGVPITDYCDKNGLPPRERLGLFLTVCCAVQHAHQKGIIHRDLKPSNVLVTLHDGTPVVKVIDFGIAKALGQQLTDKTLHTGFAQMIGTPLYMSPEQAEMSALDIDTRSDIYSLGVLLYELLTGSTPFDKERLGKAGYDEMRRIIREEEPAKPSTRLSTMGAEATVVSSRRQNDPNRLSRLYRGELDWIVMKALEKERGRRYETAAAFAADIQRYLHDEPVAACPPSAWYRFSKFARRHRSALALAAVITAALVLFAGTIGWMVRDQAEREAAAARDQAAQEARLADEKAVREAALDAEVNRALDEAVASIDAGGSSEVWGAPLQRAEKLLLAARRQGRPGRIQVLQEDLAMARRLEEAYLPGSDKNLSYKDMDKNYARAFQEFGIDLQALSVEDAAARMRERPIRLDLARALDLWTLARRRRSAPKLPDWKKLLEIAGALDPDPWRKQLRDAMGRKDQAALLALATGPNVGLQKPASLHLLGESLADCGAWEQALALLRTAQQQYPRDYRINEALAFCCLRRVQPPRLDDAVRFYACALVLRPQSPYAHVSLGEALASKGAHAEAIVAYSNAIAIKPDFTQAFLYRGNAFRIMGQTDKAMTDFARGIALNPESPDGWWARAAARGLLGQDELAIADFSEAFARGFPPSNVLWQKYLAQRAKMRLNLNDVAREQPAAGRGRTVLLGYQYWTMNGDRQRDSNEGADFRWEPLLKLKYLTPFNGARAGILNKPFAKITPEDLKEFSFKNQKIPGTDLKPGAVVAVRTADGNLAKLRIIRYRPKHDLDLKEVGFLTVNGAAFMIRAQNIQEYHLEIEWVLYRQ